jgi:hypothetical protein
MAALAELIKALATLLWPIFAFVFLWLFQAEIKTLLKRLSKLRKGRLMGQELELDEELDELKQATDKAEREVAAIPKPQQPTLDLRKTGRTLDDLLREAARSPRAALMMLAAEIEQRLRQILAAAGWHQNIRAAPLSNAVELLRRQGSLPEHVSGSVKLFQDVRNRIVHGQNATDEDVLRAIDSGLTLLRAIDSIPAMENIVYRTAIPLFADPGATQSIKDATGIMLQGTSPGGITKTLSIYPTTRSHFQIGKRVAWEWSLDKVWGKAWYRDPDTGEIKEAWHSAGEFVGRHLDDV